MMTFFIYRFDFLNGSALGNSHEIAGRGGDIATPFFVCFTAKITDSAVQSEDNRNMLAFMEQ